MAENIVSVIVPAYNVEKYIAECIDSIRVQTYENMEIILVDDGSTDNSGLICDSYSLLDERIIVIHKENGGVGSARNAGLDIACGDFITFWMEMTAMQRMQSNILLMLFIVPDAK